jgi:hypothetical protein
MVNYSAWGAKLINLHDPFNLPANGPDRSPRILDVSTLKDVEEMTSGFTAADIIATTLYKLNPKALKALLDLKIEHFHFGLLNSDDYEFYVTRTGNQIRVSAQVFQIQALCFL